MPKVVSGKGFDEFVQSGKHQVIDDKKQPTQQPKVELAPEVKDLIAKTEAETAETMQPPDEKEDNGLEAGDEDLAERAQARIAKKHREMKQAEALAKKLKAELDDTESGFKAEYLRAQTAQEEVSALRKELEGLRAQSPKAETKAGLIAPDENDPKFRNDKGEFQLKAYEQARDEYVKAQFRKELEQERADADWQLKVQAFQKRVDEARAEYPDFNEAVAERHVDVAPYIQRFMVESEQGARMGYHFAKHPDDFTRISSMHPIRGSAELGKLEAKLEAAAKKPEVEKPAPKAVAEKPGVPAPIVPLTGSGASGINTDPAKMSPKELLAYTRQREAEKKRARHGGS